MEATFRIELKIHLYERCVITILTKLPFSTQVTKIENLFICMFTGLKKQLC